MSNDGGNPPVPERTPSADRIGGDVDYGALDRTGVIGRGGSATVSRATVRGDPDRVVALKEPHVREGVPEAVADRFEREAEAWAAVDDHPHVLAVHGWGVDPHPWIAVEYADAGSLVDRIGGDPDRGLWIAACVAAALDHAHREGVAHLDLKPENVLFSETPGDAWAIPKLGDWGMAEALGPETLNLEGLSPRYAAPEQLNSDRYGRPGAATDVYQLGVVVYETLVGTAPFEGPPRTLRATVLEEPPPPASGRNPELPAEVDEVLDRALAKDPADRYDSTYDFRRELERLFSARTGYDPDGTVTGPLDGELRSSPPASPVGADDGSTASTSPPEAGDGPTASTSPGPRYERALELADEGFVQLSEAYFARRDPAPPLEAWRRGVTLADARAGRAIEREVETGDGGRAPLTDLLIDGLASGTDRVVLGAPGSGKSTVCKRVACEWFDRGHGPVFYRESGAGRRFERPDALARRASDAGGHALVVVEDAVRPDAKAVFEFLDRVRDVEGVTVLLDARESEWRDAGDNPGAFGEDPVARGREAVEPVYVPRPDEREHERFVRAVEDAADRPIDVDLEELGADVRRAAAGDPDDETQPGELFYLLHRLTALAGDPLDAGETPTTLTDAVADAYERLAGLGDDALGVGICANVLNAAGIGVHPELLYAVVPGDPLAVDEAIEVLDGRVVFPREADWSGGARAYPAVHDAWSTEFLAHAIDAEGAERAADRFGRVVSGVLSLADDPEHRERVADALPGETPSLARIEEDPERWADGTVEAVHALGRERPKLAPLFGDGDRDSFELPEACTDAVADRRPAVLGRIFLNGDYADRARRAFERLPGEGGEAAAERWAGLGRVAKNLDEYDRARECLERSLAIRRDLGDRAGEAAVLRALGIVARMQDEYDRAREYQEQSLDITRELDEREGTAEALHQLGVVARLRGDYDRALDYYGRSIEIRRAIGDRLGEARCRNDRGMTAYRQDDYEGAHEEFRRSLEVKREVGDRLGETHCLNNLGLVAQNRGNYEQAREYFERCLPVAREIGDRGTEASALNNLGTVVRLQGDLDAAAEHFEASLEIKREIGDRRGEASGLNNLGIVAQDRGDLEAAREYYERSLEIKREVGDRGREASSLTNLGIVARLQGEYDRAEEYHERSLGVRRELDDRRGEASSLDNLGRLARLQGEYDRAEEYHERSLEISREIGDRPGEAEGLTELGYVARLRGEYDRARDHLERSLELTRETGDRAAEANCLTRLAALERDQGRVEEARERLDRAADAWDDLGDAEGTAWCRLERARVALAAGDPERARDHAERARDDFEELATPPWLGRSLLCLGRIAAAEDRSTDARDHWRAALATFEDIGDPRRGLATLERLVRNYREVGADDRAAEYCGRARELLATAPDPVADQHGEWVRRECDGPEG